MIAAQVDAIDTLKQTVAEYDNSRALAGLGKRGGCASKPPDASIATQAHAWTHIGHTYQLLKVYFKVCAPPLHRVRREGAEPFLGRKLKLAQR